MTKRIFKTTLAVASFVLLFSLALVMAVFYKNLEYRLTEELVTEAKFIVMGIEAEGTKYFDGLGHINNRITLIDKSGEVLYDSVVDKSTMENHADREEVAEAMHSKEGKSVRFSQTISERTVNYAIRLNDGSILRVSTRLYTIFTLMKDILASIIMIVIASVAVSGVLAFRASQRIVKPLNMIDLENPKNCDTYEELAPMLRRISDQNDKIRLQIEELQRQQQEFSEITENMMEGFIVIDSKTNVLSYNSSAMELLNIQPQDKQQSILVINRSESVRKAVDLSLKGEHNEQKLSLNGRMYSLLSNPVRNNGEIAGAIIVIMDCTESEEREHLRREFSANVSHELKTPLTSISGIAEIMKNGIVKPNDIAHFSGKIYDEATRMISLVNDIIKLSRLDENSVEMEHQPVDLSKLILSAIERLEAAIAAQNLTVEYEPQKAVVLGVKQILDEMIFNICDNAVKYNIPNGRVQITLDVIDDFVELAVSDTGIGIPFEDKSRVFERFYRVDKSHSKEIAGTGLGLSIVKHGAAFHNAAVYLESVPSKGTTVKLSFQKYSGE